MASNFRLKSAATLATAAIALMAFWLNAQNEDARPISELMPPGALLYLEAKDFRALLNDWNSSSEKSRWLKGANYSVLSESRLVQRLSQAEGEFANVAGIPLGMPTINELAGDRSGFAFYNLSALRFVYLSHMAQNRIDATGLWDNRAHYARREVAGIPFFLKSNDDGTRTFGFAGYKDWFVLATNGNLMAETLVLLSGRKDPSIATQEWFRDASQQASAQGDLRLVYNLTSLIATPQFRTYWLERNVSKLKPFSAGISDLFRQSNSFEERRAMLRKNKIAALASDPSFREALAYAGASDSLLRVWSMPDQHTIGEALQQVISREQTNQATFNAPAPEVTASAADVGNEADLEIRVDEPPFQRASQLPLKPLIDAIVAMQPTALLHVQATRVLRDQVFVMPSSGVVLMCKQPDRAALDRALAEVSGPLNVGSIDPLHVSVDGNVVLLTRLDLARGSSLVADFPADTTYAAIYNHSLEWPHYKKLFAILDRNGPNELGGTVAATSPAFFSGNLASIGDSLARLQKASIFSADNGAIIRETERYQLSPP